MLFSKSWHCVFAQQTNSYPLHIIFTNKDSGFKAPALKTQFENELECNNYVLKLPQTLSLLGYATASVDSFFKYSQEATVYLFIGKQYKWAKILFDGMDKKTIASIGYSDAYFTNKWLNINQVRVLQQKILNYYDNNGYPFASVKLDSFVLDENKMTATFFANTGPQYHIDSIRCFGKGQISKNFLQHYLGIFNGDLYNANKLSFISKKILELPYLQEQQHSTLTMLGSGSIINLFLTPKRSSQVNFLVGFLPNSTGNGKLQITADVNLNLKNIFNQGETVFLTWQQLQTKSPKLNLGYQQPYIFNSPFGIDFSFDLFKKDSSYLQINAQLGTLYTLSSNQTGKLFIQWQNNFLQETAIDTNQIKITKQLPPNIDVSAVNVGLAYDWSKTDYKYNPLRGNELNFTAIVGTKNIKKNNEIVNLKDPNFNYASLYDSIKIKSYQIRIKFSLAHYTPLGKQSTLKTIVNAGLYSSPNIFRNELFQIGGYKLMRGFNEESFYATQYAVGSAEYRVRLAQNSYFFGFVDVGYVHNKYQKINVKNNLLGAGLGLNFETNFGLINISYALGKRDDVKFNLKQSQKIHFGYINYF